MLRDYIYKIKSKIFSCFNYRKIYITGFKQHPSSRIPLFQIEVRNKNFQTAYTLPASKIKNCSLLFDKLTPEEKIEVAYFAGIQDILEENFEITILQKQNISK